MKDRQKIGSFGEDIAVDYLQENFYKVIERNYRYGHGEIDIIAQKDDLLIFVEVKTRKNLEFGAPELAVTKNKQKQIRKIAEMYLIENNKFDLDCRIDVIAILLQKNSNPKIKHIKNAF